MLLALGLTALALVTTQRVVLTDSVDEVLAQQASSIAELIDSGQLDSELQSQGDEESFARVLNSDGDVIAETRFRPSSETGYRVRATSHGELVIETGTPLDDVNESVATLTAALSVAVPAVSLALALLVWLLVGRVLAPVEQIRSQVAAITHSSLNRRVPVPKGSDEIVQLATTMNEMLDRLEAASLRQKRFVADASHELRSPLTRIRSEIEVDLAHPDSADLGATQRSVLSEAETLETLIDDLLVLARTDELSPALVDFALVDLDDTVASEVARFRSSTGITTTTVEVSGAQVLGNAAQLARVVRNVLDNAGRHGASHVSLALVEDGEFAVLSIADDGDGIPPEFQRVVFDRFVRLDEARSPGAGGTGLGLAIARELIEAHGGTIEIDNEYTIGARFVIRIPCPNDEKL